MSKKLIDDFISDFPIYQYAYLKPDDIEFSPKVRQMCKRTCPHYGNYWSCPPATGKVDKCKAHCMRYTDVLLFSTFTELTNDNDLKERAEAQKQHDKLTDIVNNRMKDLGYITYTISSGYCKKCDKCTFPRDYCKFPNEMYPCIESHGIVMSELVSACGMDYYMGEKLSIMFSMIFFKDTGFAFSEYSREG